MGSSYIDPAAGVTITPLSIDSSGARVSMTVGAPSCAHANPLVAISPSQSPWVRAGTTVSYTVTVTNKDSIDCTSSRFDLTSAIPAGWSAGYGSPSLTLAAGASGSTTLAVASPMSAADGFYNVAATATNSGAGAYAGAATATYVVSSAANLPPVAINDSAAIATIAPVTIVVLANDSDPDNDPLRVTAVTQGAKGSVAVNADGSLTYTPGPRFKTSDSFSYSISDGHGGTASATATVQKSSGGKGKPGV